MLNLLRKNDILTCYGNSNIFPETMDSVEIIKLTNVFHRLDLSPKIFEFDENGFLTLEDKELVEKIHVKDIIDFAKKLKTLMNCKGFSTLSLGLSNPTQFVATMFEVECMCFIARQTDVIELELSPEVKINNRVKRPDFRFLTQNGFEFFCECKSVLSVNRIKKSKLMKFGKVLFPYLSEFVPDKFRVEIVFKSLPTHWNRNYSEQIAAVIRVLLEKRCMEKLELKIDGWHKTYIKLSFLSDKFYFRSPLNLGNKPSDENPTVILGESLDLESDIRSSIKDALTQLSSNKNSLVFIHGLNQDDVSKASNKFFISKGKKLANLCGVFAFSNIFNYYHNPFSKLGVSEMMAILIKDNV